MSIKSPSSYVYSVLLLLFLAPTQSYVTALPTFIARADGPLQPGQRRRLESILPRVAKESKLEVLGDGICSPQVSHDLLESRETDWTTCSNSYNGVGWSFDNNCYGALPGTVKATPAMPIHSQLGQCYYHPEKSPSDGRNTGCSSSRKRMVRRTQGIADVHSNGIDVGTISVRGIVRHKEPSADVRQDSHPRAHASPPKSQEEPIMKPRMYALPLDAWYLHRPKFQPPHRSPAASLHVSPPPPSSPASASSPPHTSSSSGQPPPPYSPGPSPSSPPLRSSSPPPPLAPRPDQTTFHGRPGAPSRQNSEGGASVSSNSGPPPLPLAPGPQQPPSPIPGALPAPVLHQV